MTTAIEYGNQHLYDLTEGKTEYLNLVKSAFEINKNNKYIDVGGFIIRACKSGHFESVKFMKEQIGEHPKWGKEVDWLISFRCACKSGNLELAKFTFKIVQMNLIKYTWTYTIISVFKWGLQYACEGGHLDVINWLIMKKTKSFYNNGLAGAASGNHVEILKKMIDLGANDFDRAFARALSCHSIDIINFLLNEKYVDLDNSIFLNNYYSNGTIQENVSSILNQYKK